MSKIVVIGSANMDTTHYLRGEFPEELTQECLNEVEKTARVLGGKGANQARASKLQANKNDEVYFIGCIGSDKAGDALIAEFENVGLNYDGVVRLEGKNTDGRIISVDSKGENRMMGYGDCVKELKPELIDESLLETADVIAIQMKMPEETVRFVIDYCTKHNKTLVIDPTPPEKAGILMEKQAELLKQGTYFTPNEEEAFALIGYAEGKTMTEIKKDFQNTPKDARLKMIEVLVDRFPNIIATVGGDGVIYKNHGKVIRKETYPTECKDSTGAGDTFNGAFIAAIARGLDLDKAVDFGLMASSMKVKYLGAQNGVPTQEETIKALDEAQKDNEEIR